VKKGDYLFIASKETFTEVQDEIIVSTASSSVNIPQEIKWYTLELDRTVVPASQPSQDDYT